MMKRSWGGCFQNDKFITEVLNEAYKDMVYDIFGSTLVVRTLSVVYNGISNSQQGICTMKNKRRILSCLQMSLRD